MINIAIKSNVGVINKSRRRKQPKASPPSFQDGQSISGSMPDPESDDDTLENAKNAGFQLNEDSEHPEAVDAGRDIDDAEDYNRTH